MSSDQEYSESQIEAVMNSIVPFVKMNQTRPGYFDDVITGGNYMVSKIVAIQNYFNSTYAEWMVSTFEVTRHLLN